MSPKGPLVPPGSLGHPILKCSGRISLLFRSRWWHMNLPADHPQRIELNDEVHARPPEPLVSPSRLSYLALLCSAAEREAGWLAVRDLCRRYGVEPPDQLVLHFSAELGPFRLKWERHTEFVRFMFIVAGTTGDPFERPAISVLPEDWLPSLPGQVIVAAHAALIKAEPDTFDPRTIGDRWFAGNMPAGAAISGGAATALTDFRIHPDGFSRHLLLDHATSPWQAGRVVQRLLEIDTYRIMALLALPVARSAGPLLAASERELSHITAALVSAGEADEPALLNRLTQLEAQLENQQSETRYRFSAADAYYELVQRRIDELREQRIQGLQTFREFTERRLAPAMSTCRSVAARQESLSLRVSRATRLLSTRVDLTRERQNQALLASMNTRSRLQLRLQSTVEGLSVAAVTYYVSALVGHAAEALKTAGLHVEPDLATGLSIPVVAVAAWYGIHRIRKIVTGSGEE
jgi:uncharacterized membrane-anchored protein